MSKKSIIARSKKKYKLSAFWLEKRKQLKNLICLEKNLLKSFQLQKKFQKLAKNSSKTRFKRFCWKTGRNRGYFRDFSLSRHVLREFAHQAKLPGLIKASW